MCYIAKIYKIIGINKYFVLKKVQVGPFLLICDVCMRPQSMLMCVYPISSSQLTSSHSVHSSRRNRRPSFLFVILRRTEGSELCIQKKALLS